MRARWMTLFLDFPASDFERGVAFWREVTGSGLSERRGPDGEFATLLPPDGDPYLRVQRIHDGEGGCHLDLHVDLAEQSLDDAAAEAVALGGTVRYREAGEVVIVESPGGFAFCFVPWNGEKTVQETSNRVTQLCLDIPPEHFDRETAFWAKLTRQAAEQSPVPGFVTLEKLPGTPLKLLFQRRQHTEPGDRVAGHVDFTSDVPERDARWHVAAGARIAAVHEGWAVMTDPGGRPYCLCALCGC